MKINSINSFINNNFKVESSKINNNHVQNTRNNDTCSVVDAKLLQAYNNISFKALNPTENNPNYQQLSSNGKDYLYLHLNYFEKPIILKPECVDTYFKDNKAKVNSSYIDDFISFYDGFYDDEVSVSDSIVSLSKEIIEQADKNSKKSPEINLSENIIPINLQKEKINYYAEQNKIKEYARAYLYNEAENKKNFPIIALDKAFMLMQLSKTQDGYNFADLYKKKAIINELFMISDKTQFDFKTPVINASKDNNGIVDLSLLTSLTDFMSESNWQEINGIEQIAGVLKTLKTNPQNDMSKIIKYLAYLTEFTHLKPEEFEYCANQCINKNTNEFNEETFATIVNLYTESEYCYSLIFDDFSDENMQKYEEIETEMIHHYLNLNNDEQTGTIREDADSIIGFTQEFLEYKKRELY